LAETKIKSRSFGTFIQPPLGGQVNVILYTAIDWFKKDVHVYIPGAGVYKVVSGMANIFRLELITYEAVPGSTVTANVAFPVDPPGSDGSGWGSREW